MFSLTISFGPGPTMWTLMWRDETKAKEAADKLRHGVDGRYNTIGGINPQYAALEDEFGQQADVKFSEIHGFMFEDMELSKLAHIERALHQARTQAQGQQAAENDQVLRVQRARSGPAVLMPGMNGMPR